MYFFLIYIRIYIYIYVYIATQEQDRHRGSILLQVFGQQFSELLPQRSQRQAWHPNFQALSEEMLSESLVAVAAVAGCFPFIVSIG